MLVLVEDDAVDAEMSLRDEWMIGIIWNEESTVVNFGV